MDNIRQGTNCLLASAKASEFVTSVAGKMTVQVNTSETGQALDECLSWYDALCLVETGQAISTQVVLDDDLFKKNSEKYANACATLRAQYSCSGDCQERWVTLIEGMRPLDDDIFPDKSFWENLKSKFSDMTDKVKDFFKDKFGIEIGCKRDFLYHQDLPSSN